MNDVAVAFVDRWISYIDFRSDDPIDVIVWSHSLPNTNGSECRPRHEGHVLHRVNEQQNIKTTCAPTKSDLRVPSARGGAFALCSFSGYDLSSIRFAKIEDVLPKSSRRIRRLLFGGHGVNWHVNERRAYGSSVMQGFILSYLQKVGWVAPSCAT